MPLISQRTYEYEPERGNRSRHDCAESLVEDIRAAARLDLPFTVRTIHDKQFRHGGNVNRATIRAYEFTLGEFEDRAKDRP